MVVPINQSCTAPTLATVPAHGQQTRTVLIRRKEVERLTSLSRSRIYVLMAEGKFPKPIRLGAMSVAWVLAEIHEWIASRIADCRGTDGGVQ
ncbi:MAG: AlpA family transcriptional regulator [Gallionellaceae bacterium]